METKQNFNKISSFNLKIKCQFLTLITHFNDCMCSKKTSKMKSENHWYGSKLKNKENSNILMDFWMGIIHI